MSTTYSASFVDDIREIKEKNPFESMMSRFDRAAQLLDLDADLYAVMRVPNRELKVYIPTRMDSGRIQVFEGYRVQHNFARGPAKGGIRYAPDVNIDEIRALRTIAGRRSRSESGPRRAWRPTHAPRIGLEITLMLVPGKPPEANADQMTAAVTTTNSAPYTHFITRQ